MMRVVVGGGGRVIRGFAPYIDPKYILLLVKLLHDGGGVGVEGP